jgi:hypothetical protein
MSEVSYRIADPCVTSLLDLGRCLNENTNSGRNASSMVSLAAGLPSSAASGGSGGI